MSFPNYEILFQHPEAELGYQDYDGIKIYFENGTKAKSEALLMNNDSGTEVAFTKIFRVSFCPDDAVIKLDKKSFIINSGSVACFSVVTTGEHNRFTFVVESKASLKAKE